MYSVTECQSVLEIKKSKFIACLFPVTEEDEVDEYLKQIKLDYPSATHYCYAYIIGAKQKCSDDHEPHGTAGAPILNVLIKRKLDYVLCVVVRYFGGIKLGAGGLVRAYSNATSQVLDSASIIELVPSYLITIAVSYEENKALSSLIKSYPILEVNYEDKINYRLEIPIQDLPLFRNYDIQIIQQRYMKKATS